MAKLKDVFQIIDGIKVTQCAYRRPKKDTMTFPIGKSRYTAWHQGVVNYVRGTRGIVGTVENFC